MDLKQTFFILRQKVFSDRWFLMLLVLIVLVAFLIIHFILNSLFRSLEKQWYAVAPLDEKAVYPALIRSPKDDFLLMTQGKFSNLNGSPAQHSITNGQPVSVIVENFAPIRAQQKGLEEADIVYEAPAEGGITRFLAIYDGKPVEKIGPVRSARPYFISWASEYRAAFLHVGGSQEAISNLKNNFRVFNIDEFADFKTIWRENRLSAPHNAYTSISLVAERLTKDQYEHPLTEKRFIFKDPDPAPGDIRNLVIDFSLPSYKVKYVYDPKTNRYVRYHGDKPHHQITPANVIVQYVKTEVLDDLGRLRIQTLGTGKALVFRDGKVTEGTWEKDGSINSDDQPLSESFTRFFDADNKKIELNRGPVWIEVVPEGRPVNYF